MLESLFGLLLPLWDVLAWFCVSHLQAYLPIKLLPVVSLLAGVLACLAVTRAA
jgi:hypothetical protein